MAVLEISYNNYSYVFLMINNLRMYVGRLYTYVASPDEIGSRLSNQDEYYDAYVYMYVNIHQQLNLCGLNLCWLSYY